MAGCKGENYHVAWDEGGYVGAYLFDWERIEEMSGRSRTWFMYITKHMNPPKMAQDAPWSSSTGKQ